MEGYIIDQYIYHLYLSHYSRVSFLLIKKNAVKEVCHVMAISSLVFCVYCILIIFLVLHLISSEAVHYDTRRNRL